MKLTPWYLVALAPLAVAGWSGALLGHVAVLAVTIGIFVGTLSLGKTIAAEPISRATAAQLVRPDTRVDANEANGSSSLGLHSPSASASGAAPRVLAPTEAA